MTAINANGKTITAIGSKIVEATLNKKQIHTHHIKNVNLDTVMQSFLLCH